MDAKSPSSNTPKRTTLSGSARKVKDNAADWHNLMLKWENLNDSGFNTANTIVNLKISAQMKDDKLEIECDDATLGKTRPNHHELEMRCTDLTNTFGDMAKLQVKMEKLTSTLKGVCDLESYHHQAGQQTAPLFHTWPTKYFYEVSLKLSDMYRKELQLKQTIVEEIAHTGDHDLMMVYLSSWLYQPYIDTSIKLLLESMLLETGHRPL
ncbi:cyclin-dependent kinase 2-interacting protein [Ambystoma mexicanum]|uniref:cyclin-dependent kinase 2-interacting protein n=1 Tax=Ambystoma mexicanum TaxID=8296 RepID=UPI0037E99AFE